MDNFFEMLKPEIEANGYAYFPLSYFFQKEGKEAHHPANDWAKRQGWLYQPAGAYGVIATSAAKLSEGVEKSIN